MKTPAPHTCKYCAPPPHDTDTELAAEEIPGTEHELADGSTSPHPPVELPAEPRPFRVHSAKGYPPLDCTLHPDGSVTAFMGGNWYRNAYPFDGIRATDWADARIEWDPAPLTTTDTPPAITAIQHTLA